MQESTLAHNEILSTSSDKASCNWDRLLQLQTDYFLPFELDYFFSCGNWGAAKRVLDLGCGNGYYLSRLQKHFPEKTFVGIDVSPELINIAQRHHTGEKLAFCCADLFDYTPPEKFDVIVMRLVLQHMAGITRVLHSVSKLLRPSGSLIIIEADPQGHHNHPNTPKFDNLLRQIEKFSQSRNANRACLSDLSSELSSLNGWRQEEHLRLSIPATGPFKGTDYLQMFLLWVEIWEQSETFNADFVDTRRELLSWAEKSATFSQIGVQLLRLCYSGNIH